MKTHAFTTTNLSTLAAKEAACTVTLADAFRVEAELVKAGHKLSVGALHIMEDWLLQADRDVQRRENYDPFSDMSIWGARVRFHWMRHDLSDAVKPSRFRIARYLITISKELAASEKAVQA